MGTTGRTQVRFTAVGRALSSVTLACRRAANAASLHTNRGNAATVRTNEAPPLTVHESCAARYLLSQLSTAARAATTMPNAAVAPIAGAPRTTITLMHSATRVTVSA